MQSVNADLSQQQLPRDRATLPFSNESVPVLFDWVVHFPWSMTALVMRRSPHPPRSSDPLHIYPLVPPHPSWFCSPLLVTFMILF